METEKLQRLYDTLEKLRPKGKHGGLGTGGLYASAKRSKDPTLPENPLYSNFVRPGAFHKRTFDNEEKVDEKEDDVIRGKNKRAKTTSAEEEDEKNNGGDEEGDATLRKSILRALKSGTVDRKQVAKDVQAKLELPKKDFKRNFKRVLNALIDADEILLRPDGAIEKVAEANEDGSKEAKKKKKEKKEKK